jgi:hypothetical protein
MIGIIIMTILLYHSSEEVYAFLSSHNYHQSTSVQISDRFPQQHQHQQLSTPTSDHSRSLRNAQHFLVLQSTMTWDHRPRIPPPQWNHNGVNSNDIQERMHTEETSSEFSETTSSTSSSLSTTIQLWKNRLITKEDSKHIHKITGLIFVLSSWGLSGYGIYDMIHNGWAVPVNRHGKPFCVLLWLLVTSSIAQSYSSIKLAVHHRQGQPAVRNTFLCNAAVAILGSGSALWSSTWYPSCLNGHFSRLFYLAMDGIGLIGMADNMIRLKSLIASRQIKTVDKTNIDQLSRIQYWKDVFVYMMPILIGLPFFVGIGYQFGLRCDRTFYLNVLDQPGHPHLNAGAVYSMVMVAMGASYSSLIVTLRDKKLIRKRTEGLSLTLIMLCLVGSLYQALKDPGTIPTILGLI